MSVDGTLIKKKIRFSSYTRKFRRERLQSHIYTVLTASSNMTKYLRISWYIRERGVCEEPNHTREKLHKKVWYTTKIINTLCFKSFKKECRFMRQYVRHLCFAACNDTTAKLWGIYFQVTLVHCNSNRYTRTCIYQLHKRNTIDYICTWSVPLLKVLRHVSPDFCFVLRIGVFFIPSSLGEGQDCRYGANFDAKVQYSSQALIGCCNDC